MAERYCAENLVFRAGQRTLINDVSLTLSQGELVALIGPNGAGKSTLLRLLTGYLKPAGGRCSLAGTPLAAWQPERLSRYRAVMRQSTQFGFDWPVEAVVGMGRAPWTRTPEASVIEEVMAITGCLPLAGRQFAALSGGEQAFVAIAIYFAILTVHPSPFCILDEIEAALDDVNVAKYASYLRTMNDRTQFILITHRRGTMEESDVLYGVTMQEKGVSKLLKLDVSEIGSEYK